ncbi:MAG: hypothetical protein ACT4OZ_04755 [Gemmatimonadota bacterium]
MRILARLSVLAFLFPVVGAAAQDSAAVAGTGPCRSITCQIIWDWGGQSASTYGQDRRYGPATDLEVLIPQFLREAGLKVSPAAGLPVQMTLRPRMRNAMCDIMAGTGTDMSCRTVSDLAVQFTSTDSTVKAPGAVRITNRCAAGDKFMSIREFSRYAADLVIYNLTDEKARGRRPASRC